LSERKLLQVNIIPNVTTQFEDTIKIPFMEFVPENTIVWLKDWTLIEQRGHDQMEALEAFLLHAPILKITDDTDAHKKNTDKMILLLLKK
jgi:transcription-repair coupling factor (superfamily II helicase)